MCDYSIQAAKTRPAVVGEKLVSGKFPGGTTGFFAPGDVDTAVCMLPGTEVAFEQAPQFLAPIMPIRYKIGEYVTARFRQINVDVPYCHHDALEFPNGEIVTVGALGGGQTVTVLQLPAAPRNEQEAKEQQRHVFAG